MSSPKLTDSFREALQCAVLWHGDQLRKGTTIPYVAHLLGVTALVLENGGDEQQAIAALLHDAVEDRGGYERLEEIRHRFGERVATIVEACSDSFEEPKPPWLERKRAYLQHLPGIPTEARLVSLADKVHNCRAILADLQQYGESVWSRFNGGKEGTLWYYRELVKVYGQIETSPLVEELKRLVEEIERYR